MNINVSIQDSKKILMQYWPLTAFIASNPLWSMRDCDFKQIINSNDFNGCMDHRFYQEQYDCDNINDNDLLLAHKRINGSTLKNNELRQWVSQSFDNRVERKQSCFLFSEHIDEYLFQNPKTWIKERIFSTLRDYFSSLEQQQPLLEFWYERDNLETHVISLTAAKPIHQAIADLLTLLEIPNFIHTDYLKRIYLQLYGWSSLMNWRDHHPNNPWINTSDRCETLLLMWLSYEYIISQHSKRVYSQQQKEKLQQVCHTDENTLAIWQTAYELHYEQHLDNLINTEKHAEPQNPNAQFIFCIDTRSEGLRRHLEQQGNYQTYGFAGFFGCIFSLSQEGILSYQAPALVTPETTLLAKRTVTPLEKLLRGFKQILRTTKKQLFSSFALFEMVGFWSLLFILFKTMQPKIAFKKHSSTLGIDNTLDTQQRYQAAHSMLTSIGLVNTFAEKIFLCAHQTDMLNNPFESSLNCGACGGNSGVANAIIMTEILNDQAVRTRLRQAGINIPDGSEFIAACHHTVYDRLEILHGTISDTIQQDINQACHLLRHEKRCSLPGYHSLSDREKCWSELIPELGLINNTAIVIGPRQLTHMQDLNRRVFLHSYEPDLDNDGEILTNILSAPVIVAHWINSQYYFSTVDPQQFGAGNKAIHNVLPGIGVLEGNLSDLKIGLPQQSTHYQSNPIHEPRRLIVLVYAYQGILQKAIQQSADFKSLIDNHWVYLKHIEVR